METFASKLKVTLLFQLPDIELSVRGRPGIGEILSFPNHILQEKINVLIRERNFQWSSLWFWRCDYTNAKNLLLPKLKTENEVSDFSM